MASSTDTKTRTAPTKAGPGDAPGIVCFPDEPRLTSSLADEIGYLWEGLKGTYAQIVKDWHAWKQFSVWGKYPASRSIDFGSPELDGVVGAALGKSLFTSLDTFLLKPSESAEDHLSKLRKIEEDFGATTSLHTFVERLQEILPSDYGASLEGIKQDLGLYDASGENNFWGKVARTKGFAEMGGSERLELVKCLADEWATGENGKQKLFATYIKTLRNEMAHNQKTPHLQMMYLLHVGYQSGVEGLLEQILDVCFGFLKSINSEVQLENNRRLEDWNSNLLKHAESLGQELMLAIDRSACEKIINEQELKHALWLNQEIDESGIGSLKEHICGVRLGYTLPLGYRAYGYRQGFFGFCETCFAKIDIISLEEHFENFEVSAVSETGENLMPAKPTKCMVIGGKWNTSLRVEYPIAEGEISRFDYSEQEKVDIRLNLWGELLWETSLTRERLIKPESLDCFKEKSEIPVERYLELQQKHEASKREATK